MTGIWESQNPEERISNKKKKKSVMKALKMSVIHVVVFVLSWTPYSAMATWYARHLVTNMLLNIDSVLYNFFLSVLAKTL